jgi:hypothetical protein
MTLFIVTYFYFYFSHFKLKNWRTNWTKKYTVKDGTFTLILWNHYFTTIHFSTGPTRYSCLKFSNNINAEQLCDFCQIDVNFIHVNQRIVWFKLNLLIYFMSDNMEELFQITEKE